MSVPTILMEQLWSSVIVLIFIARLLCFLQMKMIVLRLAIMTGIFNRPAGETNLKIKQLRVFSLLFVWLPFLRKDIVRLSI